MRCQHWIVFLLTQSSVYTLKTIHVRISSRPLLSPWKMVHIEKEFEKLTTDLFFNMWVKKEKLIMF